MVGCNAFWKSCVSGQKYILKQVKLYMLRLSYLNSLLSQKAKLFTLYLFYSGILVLNNALRQNIQCDYNRTDLLQFRV